MPDETETKGLILQLSDHYRSARRINAILCALAIAWAASQLEIKALNIGIADKIDLSQNASIPLILFFAIAYTAIRCGLEFSMQSVEIRRWGYAQMDYKVSVYLVRFAILMLAAGGLYRSASTLITIIFMSFFIMFLSVFVFAIMGLIMLPFF